MFDAKIKRIKEILAKNNLFWLVGIGLMIFVWTIIFYIDNDGVRTCQVNSKDDSYTVELEDGMQVFQSFSMPVNQLESLHLFIQAKDWNTDSHVKISLYNASDQLVKEWKVTGDEIENQTNKVGLYFSETCNVDFHTLYSFVIEPVHITKNMQWKMKCSSSNAIPGDLRINDQVMEGDLTLSIRANFRIFIWKFYIFIVILILITMGIVYVGFRKGLEFEKFAVIMIFTFGIIYNFLVPVFSVPDESIHFASSYKITNQWMGEELVDDWNCVLMRKQDVYRTNVLYTETSQLWKYYATEPDYGDEINDKVGWGVGKALNGTAISYYLPAIAIWLARILNFKALYLLLFGRLVNLLLFCFSVYIAMKLIPFGKKQLAVLAMFPMTLSLAASYSYDCMNLCGCILFFAIWLKACMQEEKVTWKEITWLLLISIIFTPIKVVYGAFLLLLLFIPACKFKNRVQIVITKIGIPAMNAIVILVNSRLNQVVERNISGKVGAYSVWEALSNPLHILNIMLSDFASKFCHYLEMAVGSQMGWFNVLIPNYIIYAFLSLFFVYCAGRGKEQIRFACQVKIGVIFCVLAGVLAILATGTLMFVHTDTKEVVKGIQGRYFIPFIMPIPIIFSVPFVQQELKEKSLIKIECALHVLTFMYMLNHYLL